jgi:hypothetical protein
LRSATFPNALPKGLSAEVIIALGNNLNPNFAFENGIGVIQYRIDRVGVCARRHDVRRPALRNLERQDEEREPGFGGVNRAHGNGSPGDWAWNPGVQPNGEARVTPPVNQGLQGIGRRRRSLSNAVGGETGNPPFAATAGADFKSAASRNWVAIRLSVASRQRKAA